MICVMGTWEEVMARFEAYREAGARITVVRFATRDQFGHLESCAEFLDRQGLLHHR